MKKLISMLLTISAFVLSLATVFADDFNGN
jgi:hypothetical protein